ncbi:MAG: hypothetical protein ACFUZC_23095 [Chthoniobacteraceae bacterium]
MNKPALLLLAAALALLPAGLAQAQVVRPAPNFSWASGKTLQSWRGQPVVLVIAPSPLSKEFRAQAKKIERDYQQFAARKVVFVAVFTQPGAENGPLCTNIPFVVVPNGADIACRYGTRIFSLNVIGRDGNLDLSSDKVESSWKIMDMIRNNAEQQASERKDLRITPVIQ